LESSADMVSRRRFLSGIIYGFSALGTAMVGIPVVGFLLQPFWRKVPNVWRPVGKVNDFAIGKTVEVTFEDASPLPWAGVTAQTAAWLRRNDAETFTAFAVNCTHLGCPVRWVADADLFMCPCHGGVYYSDGKVAGGPPPRPLHTYPCRVNSLSGNVEILTSPVPVA
jgi:menaquinol-cytochrome c reductase iron-sulfur subunit